MAEANVTKNKPLPPEMLVEIFKHCDLNELVNIVDVCQLWRDVVMSGNDLVIRRPDDINHLVSLLLKPVSFTKLHIVWDVTRRVDCSSVSLDALANATSLTRLQSFMFKVKDDDKGGYSRVLAALLTLILQTSTDTLTHLRLFHTGPDLNRKVVGVLEACQHLSHLVLNECRVGNEERRRCEDIIPRLTHLELLDLRGTHVSFELSFIRAIKTGCPNIDNNIMIRRLGVRPSDDVRVLQFVSHVDILDIVEFNTAQLRSLISSLNEHVSQLSVDELYVNWCKHHLTDDILLSLIQLLRELKMVRAQSCHKLTNEGVVNVITSLPQLEEIDISWVTFIDRGILPLLDRVVTEQNVRIVAQYTKLSRQMENKPGTPVYTGKNGNICLEYR